MNSTSHPEYNVLLCSLSSLNGYEVRPLTETEDEFEIELLASQNTNTSIFEFNSEIAAKLAQTQYKAQISQYTSHYPNSQRWLIYCKHEKVGRLWVWISETTLHLLDIVVLPTHQNKGAGTQIIRALIDNSHSKNRTFKLSVEVGNTRARSLYSRLGLRETTSNDTHIEMEKP